LGIGQTAVKPPSAAARPGLDRLGVLPARLPQVHVQVDEAGADHEPVAVEHRRAARVEPAPDRRDRAVAHEDVGDAVVAAERVDQAPAGEQQRPAVTAVAAGLGGAHRPSSGSSGSAGGIGGPPRSR
jgi:hypothetical protein